MLSENVKKYLNDPSLGGKLHKNKLNQAQENTVAKLRQKHQDSDNYEVYKTNLGPKVVIKDKSDKRFEYLIGPNGQIWEVTD